MISFDELLRSLRIFHELKPDEKRYLKKISFQNNVIEESHDTQPIKLYFLTKACF